MAGSIKYLPDGRTYDGWWHANQMTGPGIMVHADGTKQEGMWKEGKLVEAGQVKKK